MRFDIKLWPLSVNSHRGRKPPTDKAHVVSTRRWVPTNWVSRRTLQPSSQLVVTNLSVPSGFLMEGQFSGLGTVHSLLILFSTWLLPLFKRKTLSSVVDGLQKSEKQRECTLLVCISYRSVCLTGLYMFPV